MDETTLPNDVDGAEPQTLEPPFALPSEDNKENELIERDDDLREMAMGLHLNRSYLDDATYDELLRYEADHLGLFVPQR